MCKPKKICRPEFKTILPCECCPCKYQISNRYVSVAELMKYFKSTGRRLHFLSNSTPGEGPIKISFEKLPGQDSKDQPSRTRPRNTPRTSTPRTSTPRISAPRTFTPRTLTPRTSTPKKTGRAWSGISFLLNMLSLISFLTFILPKIKQTWNQEVDVVYQVRLCCISYAPNSHARPFYVNWFNFARRYLLLDSSFEMV